jgi:acetyltransferase-like isoleucine patch superfamily enzyme
MKKIIDVFSLVFVAPLVVLQFLVRLLMPAREVQSFQVLSQLLSLIPDIPGISLRRAFYGLSLDRCASNVSIGFGTTFSMPGARLGDSVYLGARCSIGLADIGADALVGSGVHILSGKRQHHFDDISRPIRLQGGERTMVRLGADVWVGNGAIILADVAAHSIVAAGSVVVDPIPEWSIAAGNPARVIRSRLDAQQA